MVQLWKRNKKVQVETSTEAIKELKDKIVSVFCSKNIICQNFKNYEQVYFELSNNENVMKMFADEELVNTATLFFENNLNITLTSKAGFMHRNTLIYRLDKLKALIGLDIRNFNDAGVLQNLINLHQIEHHPK